MAIRRNNMEVSVVIPNYNGIAFLDSVLASLEGQTLKNFEVIFVDNGSSDGSCSFVAGNYPRCTSSNCRKTMGSAVRSMRESRHPEHPMYCCSIMIQK